MARFIYESRNPGHRVSKGDATIACFEPEETPHDPHHRRNIFATDDRDLAMMLEALGETNGIRRAAGSEAPSTAATTPAPKAVETAPDEADSKPPKSTSAAKS